MYKRESDVEFSKEYFPELADVPKTERHIRFGKHNDDKNDKDKE